MKREYSGYPIVGVGAVVLKDNAILLVKRANEPCSGCWSIPGGVVDYGESLLHAVSRELLEETGLEAIPKGIIWIDNIVIHDRGGRVKYHYVIIDFLMEAKDYRLKAGSDALDVKWSRIDEALNLKLTPSTYKLIKYLRENWNSIKILPFNDTIC